MFTELENKIAGVIKFDEPLSRHTSFRVGGPADALVIPKNENDLIEVLRFCKNNDVPLTVIGNGSNLLIRDKGIRGLVLKLGNALDYSNFDNEDTIVFGSGYSLARAANIAGEYGLTGMEFAVGIPGSIGGAVYMNAGAYDGEMKNVITKVRVLTPIGEIKTLTNEELEFGYRKAILQDTNDIVIDVTLKLAKASKADVEAKMKDFNNRRITKQPLEYPSAGSTFKRPEGYFAGSLIEECGLKGYTVGGAQVSEKHAGFIINKNEATAQDILDLISVVQEKVYAEKGVKLETEVMIIGEK